jgi:hypothetical protein
MRRLPELVLLRESHRAFSVQRHSHLRRPSGPLEAQVSPRRRLRRSFLLFSTVRPSSRTARWLASLSGWQASTSVVRPRCERPNLLSKRLHYSNCIHQCVHRSNASDCSYPISEVFNLEGTEPITLVVVWPWPRPPDGDARNPRYPFFGRVRPVVLGDYISDVLEFRYAYHSHLRPSRLAAPEHPKSFWPKQRRYPTPSSASRTSFDCVRVTCLAFPGTRCRTCGRRITCAAWRLTHGSSSPDTIRLCSSVFRG